MATVKKYWYVFAILLVVVLALGYKGRHRIKAMLGMSALATPAAQMTQTNPGAPSDNIYTVKSGNLTDFAGMSLYVFDNDLASGKSTCYTTCATKWPAYSSGATAETNLPANITIMTRTDGSKQFAWKGRPLYYYYADKNPGDTLGDGISGIWHLVKP